MSTPILFHKPQNRGTAHPDDQPRFMADERGIIVHATPTLAETVGLTAAPEGKPLSALFEFCEPEDVFHAGGMFRAGQSGHYIDTIREGVHGVILTGRQGETALVRFDRVRMKNGRKFLVGSFEVDGEPTEGPNLEQEVAQWLNSGAAEKEPDVKISVQTEDSELRHFLNMSNDVMATGSRIIYARQSTFNDAGV